MPSFISYAAITALCFVVFLLLSILLAKGKGIRHASRRIPSEEVELGGAVGTDEPSGPKTTLWLVFAFIISLLALLPALYVMFFAAEPDPAARQNAAGLVGGIIGFWTGKAPEFFFRPK